MVIPAKTTQTVWVEDPELAWVRTEIDIEPETLQLTRKDGRVVQPENVHLTNTIFDDREITVADMAKLDHLHEPAILENIRRRHAAKLPYTYSGTFIVAINPYRWLDMYGPAVQARYPRGCCRDQQPHVYAVSAEAFDRVVSDQSSQSILVSGESGAGKTETSKIIMNHLAVLSQHGTQRNDVVTKVLNCNPLLESFGNAATLRNHNSSRFGKFTQLQFGDPIDGVERLLGAKINTYLLEKSRTVRQIAGERSFHIFYQVLALASSDTVTLPSLNAFSGMCWSDFRYLTASGRGKIEGVDDCVAGARTLLALQLVGVRDENLDSLICTLAGILMLGELEMRAKEDIDGEGSTVGPQSTLERLGELLGLDAESIAKSLCHRIVRARSETFMVPVLKKDAEDNRDALAKAIYARLFAWLVERCNATTEVKGSPLSVGILDIFGFEFFKSNSFEQLCINYANEKLQQKFTEDVFKSVQQEYEDEGVPWEQVGFVDNLPVLALIEGQVGVLALLNEECLRPKGSAVSFVSKLRAMHEKENAHFIRHRTQPLMFTIHHYAASVEYTATEFLVKNADSLLPNLEHLIARPVIMILLKWLLLSIHNCKAKN